MTTSYEPYKALWAEFDRLGEDAVRQALINLTLSEHADWQANLWLNYREGPFITMKNGSHVALRDLLTTPDARVRTIILDAAYWAVNSLRKIENRVHHNFDRLATSPRADTRFVSRWTGMSVRERNELVHLETLAAFAAEHEDEAETAARALRSIYGKLTGQIIRPWNS